MNIKTAAQQAIASLDYIDEHYDECIEILRELHGDVPYGKMREFAKSTGIQYSSLADYLAGRKHLSNEAMARAIIGGQRFFKLRHNTFLT